MQKAKRNSHVNNQANIVEVAKCLQFALFRWWLFSLSRGSFYSRSINSTSSIFDFISCVCGSARLVNGKQQFFAVIVGFYMVYGTLMIFNVCFCPMIYWTWKQLHIINTICVSFYFVFDYFLAVYNARVFEWVCSFIFIVVFVVVYFHSNVSIRFLYVIECVFVFMFNIYIYNFYIYIYLYLYFIRRFERKKYGRFFVIIFHCLCSSFLLLLMVVFCCRFRDKTHACTTHLYIYTWIEEVEGRRWEYGHGHGHWRG